jgi:hypothetical protein
MAQAKTWAAFDVHVSGVVAATLDRDSGELRVQRLPGSSDEVAAFAATLPGPVRATKFPPRTPVAPRKDGRAGSCRQRASRSHQWGGKHASSA